MTSRKPTTGASMSRRRFVSLVAAGSAAVFADPSLAQTATPAPRRRTRPQPARPAAMSEFERQKQGTAATLKTIRERVLPPGGELAGAFRPVRPARRMGNR